MCTRPYPDLLEHRGNATSWKRRWQDEGSAAPAAKRFFFDLDIPRQQWRGLFYDDAVDLVWAGIPTPRGDGAWSGLAQLPSAPSPLSYIIGCGERRADDE
jgi:hypothetical protein